MLKNKFLTFLLFLAITFSASFIGGLSTITFKEPWYSLLNKPTFNPPDWIFGPVWTSLYLMMTFSIWLYTALKDIIARIFIASNHSSLFFALFILNH